MCSTWWHTTTSAVPASDAASGQRPSTVRCGTPRARASDANASSMSCCWSTPVRWPARSATANEAAPPPQPTSSTLPPSGSSARAARRDGVSTGSAGGAKKVTSWCHGSAGARARISGGIPRPSWSSAHRVAAGLPMPVEYASPRPPEQPDQVMSSAGRVAGSARPPHSATTSSRPHAELTPPNARLTLSVRGTRPVETRDSPCRNARLARGRGVCAGEAARVSRSDRVSLAFRRVSSAFRREVGQVRATRAAISALGPSGAATVPRRVGSATGA